MSLFAEFLLVLVRLRLALLVDDIADIYSISKGSVSNIYTAWVNMLFHELKNILIAWPTKEQVKRHLPKSFAKFPRIRFIVDCTELKIQKPTGPSAQKVYKSPKSSYKNYKSSNTFKLLVGISSNFVSKLWSGCV